MNNLVHNFVPLVPLTIGAALPSSDGAVYAWLIGFAGVLVIVNQAMSFWKGLSSGVKEVPAPADTYTAIKECKPKHDEINRRLEALEKRYEGLLTEIKRDYESIQKSGEARASGIHNRINEVLEEVSVLRGRIEEKKK
jgi:hypothetical protein